MHTETVTPKKISAEGAVQHFTFVLTALTPLSPPHVGNIAMFLKNWKVRNITPSYPCPIHL